MTTQYTPILKLALPVTGELSGTWGDVVNDNITSMVEQAVAGLSTINTWTTNAHTLTTADGTTSEARCAMLVAADGSGGTALTGTGEIVCPAASKLYVLKNGSSYAITLKTSGGTGVAVAAGETAFLFCDGTNVNSCVTTGVNVTVTGNLTVNGNTTLGDATSDTITATGRFNTDLLPSTDNARDLGTSANSWRNLYADGTATIATLNLTNALGVAYGGTGLASGTSGGVLYYSASGTLASSAALAANAIVIGGGAGVAPSTTTTGTGVVTALGINTGTAGSFVVNGGSLGTPSAGTLTSCTGLPISTGVSGLGTNVATALAVNVGTAGAFVVNGGVLGTPSSGTLSSCSGLPISTGVSGLGTGVATALANNADATSGFATTNGTATLSGKRINPRVVAAAATSGNLTINGDTTDLYKAEGLTGAITFLTPSGTPVDGQKIIIRIKDDGTARGITWTTSSGAFRAVGITLPTTTTLSKVTYVGCIYNATDTFWDAIATVTQA